MSHLGDYFRFECKCRFLTWRQVAQMVGYRNINKGIRRLRVFEKTGFIKPELLAKVVDAIGMNWQMVEVFAEDDRQDRLRVWEQWVNEPVPMRLVVRLMPAVYCQKTVPLEIRTPEEAEKWACDWAVKHRKQVCLVLSRRWSIWIDACGSVTGRTEATLGGPNEPFMWVGNRRFLIDYTRSTTADFGSSRP
jgi:hypothetical protein